MNPQSQNGISLLELQKQFFILGFSHFFFRFSIIIDYVKSVCPTWNSLRQKVLPTTPLPYHWEINQPWMNEYVMGGYHSSYGNFCLTGHLCCLFIVNIVTPWYFTWTHLISPISRHSSLKICEQLMLLLQTTDISTQGAIRIRKHPFRVASCKAAMFLEQMGPESREQGCTQTPKWAFTPSSWQSFTIK